jgi:hypothetical protein
MKTCPDSLGIVENVYGRAKRDPTPSEPPKTSPGAQNMKTGPTPSAPRKRVRERKTCEQDPTPSVPPKTSLDAQNIKTGHVAPGTVENESGIAKHENGTRRPRYRRKRVRARKILKRDPTPSVPRETSPGVQNITTGNDTLGSAENESGAQNIKTGSDALGTAQNENGRTKHENGT